MGGITLGRRVRDPQIELKSAIPTPIAHLGDPIKNGFRRRQQSPACAQTPAFATAIESDGGQAPAMGASGIGTRSPNPSQNAWTRRREDGS